MSRVNNNCFRQGKNFIFNAFDNCQAECFDDIAKKEAEMKMMMDSEARGIVEEYQMIQQEAMAKGLGFEDLSEEEKQRVEALEAAMNENANISAFLGANQTFEQILRSVNMIITAGITGQGGGCSGCSSSGADGSCSCSGSCGTGSCGN